jgi:peptide/nickel transport system permease protein
MVSTYVLRRILLMVPTLVGATLVVFLMVRLQPGDAVVARLAESPRATQQDMDALRARLGLDEPLATQYVRWIGGAVRGDFGASLWTDRAIGPEIARRFPVSLELAFLATLLSVMLGVPGGVISAVRQDHFVDYTVRLTSIVGLSVPSFWIATLLVVVPAAWWGYLPPVEYHSFLDSPFVHMKQMAFPVVTLALPLAASVMRLTRSSMLEVLREDYTRTARAKGVSEWKVTVRHALPNAIIPVITLIGTQFSYVVGGTLIVETVFGLPGLGRMVVDAVALRDYTTVQAGVLVFAFVFLLMNLLVDLLYVVVDPRVKLT